MIADDKVHQNVTTRKHIIRYNGLMETHRLNSATTRI